MRIGIVGFPQTGKRTLFKLLTGRSVPESRKEGEIVEGIARVCDPRVDAIAKVCHPERIRYAETSVALLPDIDPAAQKREWLEGARKCDLLCAVVRAFAAPHVYHPKGSVDSERDREALTTELMLADLELVEKRLERLEKERRSGLSPAQILEQQVLAKCNGVLAEGAPLRSLALDPHERVAVRSLGLLTFQPALWAYNVDENQVREFQKPGSDCFVTSCLIETEIAGLQDAQERTAYLADLGLDGSEVERLNRAAYDLLGLMSFYTMGPDEARAWTIRKGTRAPEAGGKIHSDIERGFIRVEVIKYEDLMAAGSEEAVRRAGKEHVRGKDYVIEDGDICHFRFSV